MKNFKSVFYCCVHQLTYQNTQHLRIIWRNEIVFQLFHICCTIPLSCGIAHPCIQGKSEILKCLDMFVEQRNNVPKVEYDITGQLDLGLWPACSKP